VSVPYGPGPAQGGSAGGTSGARVAWIIFCCFMAACWAFFTWWTVIVPLVMVPLSFAAIMLPIGKAPRSPGAWTPPLQPPQHWNVTQPALGGPTQPLPSDPRPDWYKDPWGVGSRWWDGQCWTGHTFRPPDMSLLPSQPSPGVPPASTLPANAPAQPPPPPPPPPPSA